MKALASFLIVIIALHSACMAQCMGEGSHVAKETAAPPCEHHQPGTPDGDDSQAPSTTCAEGPALEAKMSSILKCFLTLAAMPGVVTAAEVSAGSFWHATQEFVGPPTSPLLVRLSALRI